MMYPRLRLARNLLTDDGVIFISIDDREVDNLKKICNEIFGEDNFINTVSVNMKNIAGASGGGEDKKLKKNIEYIQIYTKNYDQFPSFENVYNYIPIDELVGSYRKEGKSWKYTSVLLDAGKKEFIGETVTGAGEKISIFRRLAPVYKSVSTMAELEKIKESDVYRKYGDKIFRTTNAQTSIRTRIITARQNLTITDELLSIEYVPKSGKNKGILYEQFYKDDGCNLFVWLRDTSEIIENVLYKKEMQGTFWDLVGETKNLTKEGNVLFQNGKKPLKMLKRLISMQSENNDIILDFFAGSSTTAHAVIQLNAEDAGKRKFIMVQLPEPCKEDTEAFKAGYATIAEIGKERIRRAGEKIKSEIGDKAKDLDIGFKVFKLDSSNIRKWQLDYDDLENTLADAVENYVDGRSELDVVYEIILKMGHDLTYPLTTHTIAGKNIYSIGFGGLMICLDNHITTAVAKGMVKLYQELKPEVWKVVFKYNGFKSDSNKVNIREILKLAGLNNEDFVTV